MKSGKDTVILEQAGGMSKMYSKKMGEKDILIAVTYSPYAPETTDIINYASEKKPQRPSKMVSLKMKSHLLPFQRVNAPSNFVMMNFLNLIVP